MDYQALSIQEENFLREVRASVLMSERVLAVELGQLGAKPLLGERHEVSTSPHLRGGLTRRVLDGPQLKGKGIFIGPRRFGLSRVSVYDISALSANRDRSFQSGSK